MPPPLDRFRKLCRPKTTRCYQLYMLMRLVGEIGKEPLFAAVELANAEGNPSYERVVEILNLGNEDAAADPYEDEFYVEERDPSNYTALLGDGERDI